MAGTKDYDSYVEIFFLAAGMTLFLYAFSIILKENDNDDEKE